MPLPIDSEHSSAVNSRSDSPTLEPEQHLPINGASNSVLSLHTLSWNALNEAQRQANSELEPVVLPALQQPLTLEQHQALERRQAQRNMRTDAINRNIVQEIKISLAKECEISLADFEHLPEQDPDAEVSSFCEEMIESILEQCTSSIRASFGEISVSSQPKLSETAQQLEASAPEPAPEQTPDQVEASAPEPTPDQAQAQLSTSTGDLLFEEFVDLQAKHSGENQALYQEQLQTVDEMLIDARKEILDSSRIMFERTDTTSSQASGIDFSFVGASGASQEVAAQSTSARMSALQALDVRIVEIERELRDIAEQRGQNQGLEIDSLLQKVETITRELTTSPNLRLTSDDATTEERQYRKNLRDKLKTLSKEIKNQLDKDK